MPTGRTPKYQPLGDYLAAQPGDAVTVTLTLPEIERLVGQELPLSAHVPHWWMHDAARGQGRAWLRVGWRVTHAQVRRVPSAITFARVLAASTS